MTLQPFDADLAPSTGTGPRVLIIDDEPSNVALLERLLEGEAIGELVGLTDSRDALNRLEQIKPDLVLLDLHMPGIDGFQGLEVIRAARDGDFLPVLVLSADITPEARQRALGLGATDFLTKPLDRTEVLLRVRNLLRTRALHVQVQQHNATLRRSLNARLREEHRQADLRRERVERVRHVLQHGGMSVLFQPIMALKSREVVGVEALARFTGGPVRPPDEWFAEAAQVGKAIELELAAINLALGQRELLGPGAFLSVNVSPEVAAAPAFAALLETVAAEHLVVEITEHSRVEDHLPLLEALAPLRARGVQVAVDDAGSGYAGLQQILRLRPEILKLDNDLTRGIDQDPTRRALTTAMLTFATELGATIIAEGIETAEELDTLLDLGVPWGQGYHLARPAALATTPATPTPT